MPLKLETINEIAIELGVNPSFIEKDWYEERRAGFGVKFLDALEASFDHILENPRLYMEAIPGVRRSVTRTFPYLVFYVFEGDTVHNIGSDSCSTESKLHCKKSWHIAAELVTGSVW